MLTYPALGFGLGLRVTHYDAILAAQPAVDWFEVLTENYLVPGGRPLHYLTRIRERYPLAMHGVSLSIGGSAHSIASTCASSNRSRSASSLPGSRITCAGQASPGVTRTTCCRCHTPRRRLLP
jgi:hypothetical protein